MQDFPGQAHYFGGGATESIINPIVAVAMVVVIMMIFCLPRKFAIAPVLLGIFLIPQGEQIYALGVHWMAPRIIILAGLARGMADKKGSLFAGGFNAIDRALVTCVVCQSICFILLYHDGNAVVNRFGFLIDELGAYIVMRTLIQDDESVYRSLKCLAFLSVILAVTMVREQQTLQNVFGLLGGVQIVPEVREHKIRSQGVFQHSLTAGTFAATLVPMFLLLWYNGKAKVAAAMGLVGCTVMTICSNSSTPLLAYVAGLLGICFWPIRERMRNVRKILTFSLISLHLVMKAPVWFLLARIDLTGGSSGYHRAELIDQCVRHFRDWWLIGTTDAGSWAFDMWDSQDQYVQIAESGGLLSIVFFIVMIKRVYGTLGNARKAVLSSKEQQWKLWFLGSAMFAHLMSFFGINYFDQSRVNWFLLLAAVSAVTAPMLQKGGLEQQTLATVGGSGTGFHEAFKELAVAGPGWENSSDSIASSVWRE